jgi:hypothetical protein
MEDNRLSQVNVSEEFRRFMHILIDLLADDLRETTSHSDMPVLYYSCPDNPVSGGDQADYLT